MDFDSDFKKPAQTRLRTISNLRDCFSTVARHLIAVMSVVIGFQVTASEYSQPGFYELDHYVLDNGMHVILKPRHGARSVAVELNVNIGHQNFPCGKRETAHFLEHLLFTGTTLHSETELEHLIESHGGSWNAETSSDYTLYSLEIFSKHMDVGLITLHEIITGSTISEENVERSRRIVFRESGGKPSSLREWLYKNSIIQSATARALNTVFPGIDYQCPGLDENSSVTRGEVLQAYRDYYVAANMALAVVGDFEPDRAKQLITQTFGAMPRRTLDGVKPRPLPAAFKGAPGIIEGRWDPLVGAEATIYFIYRTGGLYSSHYYALDVLENYFQTELYNQLRIETGMAYAPNAYTYLYDDYGAFILETDSELDDVEQSIELIKNALAQYRQGKLDQERLGNVKQKILLNSARGYESNRSFAEYYALTVEDIKRYGKYENYEDLIEEVSIEAVRGATAAYLNDDNLVVAVVRPTLTYTQFYLLVLLMMGLILAAAWRLVRKIRLRRPRNS
ncbi:MAG: insulinase family protein [Gammaproteobacteria bacterium]|nr:insulinase family protein [Gammaproteobacteria bacterium]